MAHLEIEYAPIYRLQNGPDINNCEFPYTLPFVFGPCPPDSGNQTVIQMSGNITLNELNAEGQIAVTKFAEDVDPTCRNRRILNKYGWVPTRTPKPPRGFKNCKIKF